MYKSLRDSSLILLMNIVVNTTINALDSRDIKILILSQENEYNSKIAQNLENDVIGQSKNINELPPYVSLSHRDFIHNGDWTILPILPKVLEVQKDNSKWLLICNEQTKINLENLLYTLDKYDSNQDIWFGYGLFDYDVTIIHHFASHEDPQKFLYPNIGSGFVISASLLEKISERIQSQYYEHPDNDIEFSIDASHELSLFIWDNNKGVPLIHEPNFCINFSTNCATYVQPFETCGHPVDINKIYFAVKTCNKFHKDRAEVVKNTWGKYVENLRYFSDTTDLNIPTISLNIPNTDHGHCEKTFSIIKYANNEIRTSDMKWIVITDDDTIISPYRLSTMLSCYNSDEYIAIGERYGYRVQNLDQKGYNYLTGGSGMVLSQNLVQKIVENPNICSCPRIDSPDDMVLGMCLARLGVKIIHSSNFHQARPNDYSPDYLSRTDAVSFHKHWMIDPSKMYQEWFEDSDKILSKTEKSKTEL